MQAFHILRQGGVILTAILLAHAGVEKSVIGQFEQLLYIGYSLTFFWVAGLIQGLLSSFHDYDQRHKERFLWTAYILFFSLSLLVYCLLLAFPGFIFSVFTKGQEVFHYQLFIGYLLLNTPSYLLENIFLLKNESRKIYFFGFYSFLGYLLALMLPVWLGYPFRFSMIALCTYGFSKHLYLGWVLWKGTPLAIDYSLLSNWVRLSFPLIVYALLGGLMQTFDGWIINYWYNGDPERFAVFRYGARELPLVLAMAAAFSSALLPEVRKDTKGALIAIKNKSLRLFHLLFPLSILLLAFSSYWFPLVFTRSFAESVIIFDTYLIIISSRLIFSRTVLVGLQDNRMVLYISLVELLLNVGLSIWLIGSLGLLGVAFATFLAFSIEKIGLCLYLWYRHDISLRQYTHLSWWGIYSLVLLVLYFYKNLEYFSL